MEMAVVPVSFGEFVFVSLILMSHLVILMPHLATISSKLSELPWLAGEEEMGPARQSSTEVVQSSCLESDVICTWEGSPLFSVSQGGQIFLLPRTNRFKQKSSLSV